ncbi:hypothetical protein NQ318_019396 [Aromia moschata]|uniref:Large ribosomal subunit protein mL38 n=1 Tax=Aromia moschata TaxID=1265417 RepID=A0AAV8XF09_9CUCU|nr:hypothetical protein NQ318_019396 [Aromia moschata]
MFSDITNKYEKLNRKKMACCLWKICNNASNLSGNINSFLYYSLRYGHHLRGKPPGIAKSLDQKLAEKTYSDPAIHFKVDIGLPPPKYSRTKQLEDRLQMLKQQRKNPDLEKLSRNKKLLINLEDTKREWLTTAGPYHIKQIADHYGVFQHLFGDAYFYPRVPISITYDNEDGKLPVYFGNIVKPSEAATKPEVTYESDENTLWSLILTNPDGHFTNSEKVTFLAMQLTKAETLVQYLQPFPPKGTGYHRHVFILYKQDKKLDFSNLLLSERTFSTYDFYRNLQDSITPASLAFFQSIWDPSLKHFYHNILNMKEPIYEYDFPPPYIKPQKWYPLREPFNLYMDKYRDPKQINKEFLQRKLKNVHPFKAPPPPLPYPNAQHFENYVPSWLKLEIRKSWLKWGRINDIE